MMILLPRGNKQVVKSAVNLTIGDMGHPSSKRSSGDDFEANSCGTSNQSSRELHYE